MKSLVKSTAITSIGFYLLTLVVPGIEVAGGLRTYVLASVVLTLLNLTVRPLVNLLLLPINLLTLGMLRWLVNVLTLWMVSVFVDQLTIASFTFSGYSYQGFTVPEMTLSVFWTATLGAFLLSLFTSLIEWLISD